VADAERRARAKVKNRLGTVRFALRVFPEQHVQPVFKDEFFPFVIPKIAQ
jgi:hypothetical protein